MKKLVGENVVSKMIGFDDVSYLCSSFKPQQGNFLFFIHLPHTLNTLSYNNIFVSKKRILWFPSRTDTPDT